MAPPLRKALLSVSDKTGIVDFARRLSACGVELVSTGGTARTLSEAGLPVTKVSDLTGAPEIFHGRVKTLHPTVQGGILGRWDLAEDREEAGANGIEPIGMVVVNLYPFRETVAKPGIEEAEAIEQIDIGGPTMLRAAAKNHAHTAVVVDPADYDRVATAVEAGTLGELRRDLAINAFRHTAAYDTAIVGYFDRVASIAGGLGREAAELPETLQIAAPRVAELRYGENPHQRAGFYALSTPAGEPSLAKAEQLWGKALSYNNLLDLDGAFGLCVDLVGTGAVVVKHGNPAGAAEAVTADEPLAQVYARALSTDPMSAFGGIVALNREVDAATAGKLVETFLEAIIAPGFTAEALPILQKKKNLRLLKHDPWPRAGKHLEIRRIAGGLLVQDRDDQIEDVRASKVATERAPTEAEWAALDFAWRCSRFVKSNAIVFARAGALLGVGAGQMSRVDASKIAAMKAAEHGHDLQGSVVASDAFFPFADGVEAAAAAGATAVVQPGGSRRDAEVIEAANRLGLAMVFTGARHFRH